MSAEHFEDISLFTEYRKKPLPTKLLGSKLLILYI